jgi:hypothetical protein
MQRFQCKNCGAGLEFDPKTHGMKCDYCDSVEVIPYEQVTPEEHDIFSAPRNKGWDMEVSTIQCESCGATISAPKLAGGCSFCGSSYVKETESNPDIIRPETMIPFKISRDRARASFKKWIGGGWFRPSNLKKLARPERLRGVYTPFWTFDCTTHSDWSAMSGYYYYETKTVRTSQGTRTERVQHVRWAPTSGSRDDIYDDVLILASKGLDEGLVNDIKPFYLNQLEPYNARFMAGWQAEEYVIGLPEGWMKARWIVNDAERTKCARVVPGDTYRALIVNTQTDNVKYKHLLLPVWVSAYRYKDKSYQFLINGQTGEIRGKAPISWVKVGITVALVAGAAALLAWIFG